MGLANRRGVAGVCIGGVVVFGERRGIVSAIERPANHHWHFGGGAGDWGHRATKAGGLMQFDADIRQWRTWQGFRAHLFQHDRHICNWARGAVIHHTWKPTPVQWRGMTSMQSLKRYYEGLGWTAGPHLFICAGAPNPADDGIWQLTPLNLRGIHAGVCNPTTWGIEVVGDYDKAPWSDATSTLVTHAVRALFDWRELDTTPKTLKGHRDCNSPKTCPGTAINLDHVRRQVLALDDWGYRYAR